ncbi:hypothetical protein MYOV002v2_p0192 [Vibrio phage 144E46.1]|nr:hypothetical protein MYOV002v2_p0192 [Vibrio phage 144E46.1]
MFRTLLPYLRAGLEPTTSEVDSKKEFILTNDRARRSTN